MNKDYSFSYDLLLEQGNIILCGVIDAKMAQSIISQLLYLDSKYPKRDIKLLINSPGGEVQAGLAIYDTINYIESDVQTIAIGMAASMAAFLLSSGTRGKRAALPNAEILIHQPLGGAQGQASDILIAAKNIEKVRDRLNEILMLNTGKSKEQIMMDSDRDFIMSSSEAKEYGLIDEVIITKPKAAKEDIYGKDY